MSEHSDFFEAFKQDFVKEFEKLQHEGQLKNVILTEWTMSTSPNFLTRYALFALDSHDGEETKIYLSFDYLQIKDFYSNDNIENKDQYIQGSLDKVNRYYKKLHKINKW